MEKLLLMGVDTATKFIAAEAKRKGIYTIITDYQSLENCPLKRVVDEAWFLNVGDLDELEKKCRESGVTSVMAGNHEFCLDCTKELCKRLHLPFYANDNCWNVARDKIRFKELCAESGLLVAKDYSLGDQIQYPVCVKPSDSSAQRGISVVYEEKDLQAAYDKAMSFSQNKKIIIEQFLTGQEILMIGYADHGEYHLLFVGDTLSVICAGKECIATAPHSPSGAKAMIEHNGKGLWTLLNKMDHQNGLFILQGFLQEDESFYLLESGIRFDGGVTSHLASQVYGVNAVSWMIDLARGIKPVIDWSLVDITRKKECYMPLAIYCNPGTIKEISGVEAVAEIPGVEFLLNRFKVGDTVIDVGNMTQVAFYMHFIADSADEMINKLKKVEDTLKIYDENGNNLLIFVTEYERIYRSFTR